MVVASASWRLALMLRTVHTVFLPQRAGLTLVTLAILGESSSQVRAVTPGVALQAGWGELEELLLPHTS